MERWIQIRGYENEYEVSNLGNIRSKDTVHRHGRTASTQIHKGVIIKQRKDSRCLYNIVNLHKDGTTKTFLVHRLVAEAWVKNPNNYDCINHKDENKNNNRADNLEWCTHRYNSEYSFAIPVIAIDETGAEIRFVSINDAARSLGVNCGCIVKNLKGKTKMVSNKYRFKRLEVLK